MKLIRIIKSKIVFKLTMLFAIALLIFGIIISIVFMFLFRNHTIDFHKIDMQQRAEQISGKLSGFMEKSQISHQQGYGAYIKFIQDIAGADAWVIDSEFNVVTSGNGSHSNQNYLKIPQNYLPQVEQVLDNQVTFDESFNETLEKTTLTVGVPIISNNKTIGAVFLYSAIDSINPAIKQGFLIMIISISIAFVVCLILSIIFSIFFTRPLTNIKNVSLKLVNGDYSRKTNVKSKDEIGELANTIDILAKTLNDVDEQRNKLDNMKKDFISNISHELKTPITVIRGSLEAIIDNVVVDENLVLEYNQHMLKETIFLQHLVNDLLDLSKLESPEFKIQKELICVYDLVNDVVNSANHIAKQKNIKVFQNEISKNFFINGDYIRLRQMLIIFLDNAIKFSFENQNVEIFYGDETFLIKDYGVGIEKDNQEFMFERFYKSRDEQNKNGTGLGLCIAKQIANRHNLKLEIKSEKNTGTEIIIKKCH